MLRIIHKILFKGHIFQFYLMLEKFQGVILYGNSDTILDFWILKPFIYSYIMKYKFKKYYVFQKLFKKLFKMYHANEILFNVALYRKKPPV